LDAKTDAKTDGKAASGAASAPAAAAAPAPAPVPAAAAPAIEAEPAWAWPANGGVIAGFDEQRNKGLGLSGKAGDPVLAAADGRVMYAGSGLRGYGNMVIIKHNDTYLSAYAHNQTLLVKEDQVVKKGQPIAEMGSSDTDQVKLHFEIRRKGKPVDPARLLPPR
jgi:lipoprotein NlpD